MWVNMGVHFVALVFVSLFSKGFGFSEAWRFAVRQLRILWDRSCDVCLFEAIVRQRKFMG
jgi:hypothetical protein